MKLRTLFLLAPLCLHAAVHSIGAEAELKNLKVDGGIEDGKARLVIEALLNHQSANREALIFSTSLLHLIRADKDKITHTFNFTFEILQGIAQEIPLIL